SSITRPSATLVSGSAETVTLQARDAAGNNIAVGGLTVVFSTTGAGTSTGTIGATTDNANGTYAASFTGVLAGTPRAITATIGGVAVTSTLPTIQVMPGAATTATSLVTTSSPSIASGTTA